MAKRPKTPDATESPQSKSASTLTSDERLSPLFKSLRFIDAIEDPEERRKVALDRLDEICKLALNRQRTVKNGEVVWDPDCNAACKIDEVAHRLLAIEPARPKPRENALDPFREAPPLKAVK